MLIGLITIISTVILAIIIHYFCLVGLGKLSTQLAIAEKKKIAVLVIGTLCGNFIEITLFGIVSYMLSVTEYGTLMYHTEAASFIEHVYFSMTSFSTGGIGDLMPTGINRFLAGAESVTGPVLLSWSASFLYAEMQQHWTTD